MAKGKNRSTSSPSDNSGSRRDPSVRSTRSRSIANFQLPVFQPSPFVQLPVLPETRLLDVEDRRVFHFDGPNRPALLDDGRPSKVRLRDRPKNRNRVKPQAYRFGPKVYSQTKAILAFAEPDRTVVCIRRQTRKEVLFAKKRAGRGGMRRPKRSWLSKISCRR